MQRSRFNLTVGVGRSRKRLLAEGLAPVASGGARLGAPASSPASSDSVPGLEPGISGKRGLAVAN